MAYSRAEPVSCYSELLSLWSLQSFQSQGFSLFHWSIQTKRLDSREVHPFSVQEMGNSGFVELEEAPSCMESRRS